MDAPSVSQQRVTELLEQWSQGDDVALAELTPLVNEAYLHLADQSNPHWQNRAHFFAVAARAMRRILVNYARSQRSQKRGGGAVKVELDDSALVSPQES